MPFNFAPTNFVLSGGGVPAAFSYSSAITELNKTSGFSFSNIKRYAGSSAGALAATMLALGYTPAELVHALYTTDLENLLPGGLLSCGLCRLFSEYGWYSNKNLRAVLEKIIKHKTNNKNITFQGLKDLGLGELYIVTTRVYESEGRAKLDSFTYSCETAASTPILLPLLASMSYPIYYPPVYLREAAEGCYVVDSEGVANLDGGIECNYPIREFDKRKYIEPANLDQANDIVINQQSFGLRMTSRDDIVFLQERARQINSIPKKRPNKFWSSLLVGLTRREDNEFLESHDPIRTIEIDKGNLSGRQFKLTKQQKEACESAGIEAVRHFVAEISLANQASRVREGASSRLLERRAGMFSNLPSLDGYHRLASEPESKLEAKTNHV